MNLKLFVLIFFLSNMGKQIVNDTWLENSSFSFCFKPWKIIKRNPLMQKHKQKTLQKFYLVKLSEILHFLATVDMKRVINCFASGVRK